MDGGDRDREEFEFLAGESKRPEKAREQSAETARQWEQQSANSASAASKSTFERFKTFIDGNLTTLSEGIRHFPGNIAELKARLRQERAARMMEEQMIWHDWTWSRDTPDHIQMSIERASQDEKEEVRTSTCMLLREAWRRSKDVPEQKMIDLFRDNEWGFGGLDHFANPMLSFGGACYYKAETVDNLPSTARWGWPTPAPRWLSVDWFKRSPYSPVRLEGELPPFQSPDHAAVWRAAFEELMCVALDKPMNSREQVGERLPYGRPQSTHYGPGLDWMLSLQCRGILPPLLPALYKDDVRGRASMSRWRASMEERSVTSFDVDANLSKDFDALVREVSIKSVPEFEQEPLRWPQVAVNTIIRRAKAGQSMSSSTSWQVPDTEEDLYVQLLGSQPSEQSQPSNAAQEDEEEEEEEDEYDIEDDEDERDLLDDIKFALSVEQIDEAGRLIEELRAKGHNNIILSLLNDIQWDHYWGRESEFVDDGLKKLVAGSKKMLEDETWRRIVAMSLEERYQFFNELVQICDPDSALLEDDPSHDKMPEYMARVGPKMVQRLLRDIEGERQSQQRVDADEDIRAKMIEAAERKPNVLSQLTTTSTTRSPDGTVTTKVVLKQRFADGTTQEHESVQTSYEGDDASDIEPTKGSAKEKKSGWFWS